MANTNKKLHRLIEAVKELLHEGVVDQHQLFERLKNVEPAHYSVVRRAIHIAKSGIYR